MSDAANPRRWEQVTDPDDPRVGDFTALNDPVLRRRVERAGDYFVVEGVLAIERLLALPQWQIRSLLFLPKVAERLGESGLFRQRFGSDAGEGVPVLVADEAVLSEVVGFDLHRGALAAVDRHPKVDLAVGATTVADLSPHGAPIVVAERVNDHENLGALYRNAAAFGVGSVVVDPTCADPFYRRSVRVSLGHVLALPTFQAGAFPEALQHLHDLGVTTVALTPQGDEDLHDLDRGSLGNAPVALLVGAEGPGLSAATLAAAHHRVAIKMASDVDSLNVATAAAVALHHLVR